jgi:cytochrome P450
LWLWLAAANHDTTRFPDADQFIVGRDDIRHLAFAALARLELKLSLLRLRARYPTLRIADPEVEWPMNAAMRCPARLDVRHS